MPHARKTDSRHAQPSLEFAELRQQMIAEQIGSRGIHDPRVLEAMSRVPREEFVPAGLRENAYDDCALPIGLGQTISQPFTVAFMCQADRLQGHETVLEIGTGSGYGAAVLAELAQRVFTMERIAPLAEQARHRLHRLGYDRVTVCTANGTLGLPEESPFDAIIVTAGAEALPQAYVDQLAEGGRLLIPLGSRGACQTMYRMTKQAGHLVVDDLGPFSFVPLIRGQGWPE